MGLSRRLLTSTAAAVLLSAHAFAAGLEPGATLDASTASQAEGLLPPETLEHYKKGEFVNTIGAWPDRPEWSADFAKATAENATKLDVNADGTIVDKATGEQAKELDGLPFTIDATDPKAGVKAIWNAYYSSWRAGSSHDVLALDWIGESGLQRQAVMESYILFYEGGPKARRPENPLNLYAQTYANVTSPADLNGTASLLWRSRDPKKQDQSWTYIPALKRVRQVSPTNRSDGFLGSDLSQDDGQFFDGKPEDFEWKLVGQEDALVLADPNSLAGTVKRTAHPNGSFSEEWPVGQKVIGYQDPDWKGIAWAPVAPVRTKRKVLVVEAKPKDKYYLFSRIEIRLDAETFAGTITRKFDAQGKLLRTLEYTSYAPQAPLDLAGEPTILPGSSMGYILAENPPQKRATVAGTVPPGASVHVRRDQLDPGLFALDRLGKGK